MPVPAAPTDEGVLFHVLEVLGGGLFGFLVAVVSFRTRLARIESRHRALAADVAERTEARDAEMTALERAFTHRAESIENGIAEWRRTSDRRQLFIVEMLSDIANKVGANQRMNDLAIRLLGAEQGEPP